MSIVCYLSLVFTCACIPREGPEHRIFATLLHMVPGLKSCLMEGSDDDLTMIAEMVGPIGVLSDIALIISKDPERYFKF